MKRPRMFSLIVATLAGALLVPAKADAYQYRVLIDESAVQAKFDLFLDDAGDGVADGTARVTFYQRVYESPFSAKVSDAKIGPDGDPDFSFGTGRLEFAFSNQFVSATWDGWNVLTGVPYTITAAMPEPSAALVFAIGLAIAAGATRKGSRHS